MSAALAFAIVALSIVANGFFAGVETGVTSARRVRLLHWARRGRWGAGSAAKLLRRREDSIVAAVVGNNVAIIVGTSVATAWAVQEMGGRGELVAAATMATLNIVFGEILPKSLFRSRPEALLRASAWVFEACNFLLLPLRVFVAACARAVLWLLGERGAMRESGFSREDLLRVFAMSRDRRQLDDQESQLLHRFVQHVHRPVSECITPIANVSLLASNSTVGMALETVRETGHSRLPVCGSDGSVTGLLAFHDLVGEERDAPIEALVRDIVRIPSALSIDEAIGTLTDRQVSLALVVDERRVPQGIVSLEDLLEPFVGDIDDEHDLNDRSAV